MKPRRGDAVLFWSINPNGAFDPKSLHGSCPVVRHQVAARGALRRQRAAGAQSDQGDVSGLLLVC